MVKLALGRADGAWSEALYKTYDGRFLTLAMSTEAYCIILLSKQVHFHFLA